MPYKFQVGDCVQLKEPYRARRLAYDPSDIVANATSIKVAGTRNGDLYIVFDCSLNMWVSDCFVLADGPW